MVVFQALTWEARDEDDEHLISIFGKTESGKSICVTTSFTPYFFIKLDSRVSAKELYKTIDEKCPECVISYSVMDSKDVWGFQNNQMFRFMKIDFVNLQTRRRVDYFLRRPLHLYSSGLFKAKVYESNLDPVLRLMHRTGIQSTGWLDTGDKCIRSHLANVDFVMIGLR